MGNGFAYAVLAAWPLFAIYWYRTKNIQTATIITILGGFLLLPVKTEIDLPMIPGMGKHTTPVVAVLIGCWLIKKQSILCLNELGKVKYLVVLLIVTPFITAALNSDSLIIGGRYIKGLTYYDGFSATINQFLLISPFFIGRQFFKTYEHQLLMFKTLVIAGLLYSLPMLFEVRMSPQLHTWIYGYFPHSFGQQIRFGGFRPVVFMGHGLTVAFFTWVAFSSSIVLWMNRVKIRKFSNAFVSSYLFILLVLCKSVMPLVFAVFSWLMIKKTRVKYQLQAALLLVAISMLYPILTMVSIFPHAKVIEISKMAGEERVQSLQFRFDNEKILFERAEQRFFFGWGGWGRNRIYDEQTGKDISVTDGRWIQTLGTKGVFGFIAEFGLLATSVFYAYLASKKLTKRKEKNLLAMHALLIGIIMINLLPNSSLKPWVWLLAGILLGRSQNILTQHKVEKIDRAK